MRNAHDADVEQRILHSFDDLRRALEVQQWREHGRGWIERPPPVEIRMSEPPTFLGGSAASGTRSHWMRIPRDIGDDPHLHADRWHTHTQESLALVGDRGSARGTMHDDDGRLVASVMQEVLIRQLNSR